MYFLEYDPSQTVYYVYGVIMGLDRLIPAGPGIEPDSVVIGIGQGDLVALASPVARTHFDPAQITARLTDQAWLAPRLCAHQAVLSSIEGAVVPLCFGTIFQDQDTVRAMLRANEATLAATLLCSGGQRVQAKTTIDAPQVLQTAVDTVEWARGVRIVSPSHLT